MHEAVHTIYDDHFGILWVTLALFGLLGGIVTILWKGILRYRRVGILLRKSESDNRELNRQFQTLLDGIPDHLMLLGSDMRLLWVNRAGQEFIKSAPVSPEFPPCYSTWSKRDAPCPACPVQSCFSTGTAQEVIMQTGTRIFGVKAFPLKNEQGEVDKVIKLATDITDKIQLRDEAERNSRLSFIGEISTSIAHEINNPNGLILGNLAVIDESFADARSILDGHYDQHGDFPFGGLPYSRMQKELPFVIEESLDSARRIRQIVEDLKDFTRGGSELQETEECDLNAIAQRAIQMSQRRISQKTENFQVHLSHSRPLLHGNRRRLEQVLINLLNNACQALPDRTRGLSVTTDYDVERNECSLVVRDEGVGILAESLPLITSPFFTTCREEGGTGLGLSISKRIVTEHGGSISFDSAPGLGTTVTVRLPGKAEVPP